MVEIQTTYTLVEKATSRQWVWDKVAGKAIDGPSKRKMTVAETALFASLDKKNPHTLSLKKETDLFILLISRIKVKHGGARSGAGRKPGGKNRDRLPAAALRKTIGVRLPGAMVDWIRAQDEPAGRIIERAINKLRFETDQ